MYTLYARPVAGSAVVEAVLALAGVPYHIIDLERGADGRFPDAFYTLNPLGQVPTLILPDDSVMTESAAIAIYLADLFPSAGLAPAPSSPERARYLRWMVFLATTVYMSDLRLYYPQRYTADAEGTAGVKQAGIEAMAREWEVFAAALGEGPFILGERMSAVDIYAAMLATWNVDVPEFFARHPNVKMLYDKVKAIPEIAAVWDRNKMEG
jgi:glutathione S-transferase